MKARRTLAAFSAAAAMLALLAITPVTASAACDDGHWPATVQGQPTAFHAGSAAGDYLWHDQAGWHLRVTHAGDREVVFTGRIVSSAPLDDVPVKLEGRDTVALSADRKVITYRLTNYGGVDGFDFRTSCAQRLTFSGSADGQGLPVGRIWLGHDNHHPLQNPFSVVREG